jgi:predicted nucleotidyltransferase
MIEADIIIETLRRCEAELRAAGIRHVSLFGSVARGEPHDTSDVDLAVELEPDSCMDLVGLVSLERRLGDLLGCRVDLLPEPVETARFQQVIDRERRRAF